jgi:hypothetical protein
MHLSGIGINPKIALIRVGLIDYIAGKKKGRLRGLGVQQESISDA